MVAIIVTVFYIFDRRFRNFFTKKSIKKIDIFRRIVTFSAAKWLIFYTIFYHNYTMSNYNANLQFFYTNFFYPKFLFFYANFFTSRFLHQFFTPKFLLSSPKFLFCLHHFFQQKYCFFTPKFLHFLHQLENLGRSNLKNGVIVETFISLSSPQNGQFGEPSMVTDKLPFMGDKCGLWKFLYKLTGQLFSIGNYWRDPYHLKEYRRGWKNIWKKIFGRKNFKEIIFQKIKKIQKFTIFARFWPSTNIAILRLRDAALRIITLSAKCRIFLRNVNIYILHHNFSVFRQNFDFQVFLREKLKKIFQPKIQ